MKDAKESLTIEYPVELLLSLKESKEGFEREARLLLAAKLFELGKISSGMASRLAGVSRIEFLLNLHRFKVSPFDLTAEELKQDVRNA